MFFVCSYTIIPQNTNHFQIVRDSVNFEKLGAAETGIWSHLIIKKIINYLLFSFDLFCFL